MDDTNDKPLIATRVTTLQEAVELSLKEPWNKNCLFDYSRLLKAFEATTKSKLKPVEQAAAFTHWWNTAKSRSWLPSDASFDEYRLEFADTFTKTNTPHGANPLHEAIHRADADPLPTPAARYDSPKIRRLVAVCYQLQILAGDNPFFLSVRDAAKILGTKNLNWANAMLAGLVSDRTLIEVEKGTPGGTKATRFKFNLVAGTP